MQVRIAGSCIRLRSNSLVGDNTDKGGRGLDMDIRAFFVSAGSLEKEPAMATLSL